MSSRSGKRISQRPVACLSTWQDRAVVYVVPWCETSGAPSSPYSHNNGSHAALSSITGGINARSKLDALDWFRTALRQLTGAIRDLEKPHTKIVPGPVTAGYCPKGLIESDAAYFASVRKMFPTIGAKFGPVGHPDSSTRPPGIDPIEWHYAQDELPDDEVTCLIATDFDGSDEIELGFHQGGGWWRSSDSSALAKVYAWAHAPIKPPKKGERR